MFIPAFEDKKRREQESTKEEVLLPLPDYSIDYERWKQQQEEKIVDEKVDTVIHIQII